MERTLKGIRLIGMATFGPLMAGIVMRGEMVPPGGNEGGWAPNWVVQIRGQFPVVAR